MSIRSYIFFFNGPRGFFYIPTVFYSIQRSIFFKLFFCRVARLVFFGGWCTWAVCEDGTVHSQRNWRALKRSALGLEVPASIRSLHGNLSFMMELSKFKKRQWSAAKPWGLARKCDWASLRFHYAIYATGFCLQWLAQSTEELESIMEPSENNDWFILNKS